MKPDNGNGDVSVRVKNSAVGRKTPNKQSRTLFTLKKKVPLTTWPYSAKLGTKIFKNEINVL